MTELRRLTPEDWRLFREIRLAALAEAPYAYGSTSADWEGANDTERRWLKRLTDVPYNAIGYAGDNEIELISMWVAPFARGRGIADALIRAVVEYARTSGARGVYLHVRETNVTARAAYVRNGFVYGDVAVDESGFVEREMIFRVAE